MTAPIRLKAPGPKKLLALDGGGIRGAMTIEVLEAIEALLRKELGKPDLVLADYFDFVAGTSTGAILAASISHGMSCKDLRTFYEQSGPLMFDKASLLDRFRFRYDDEPLAEKLKEVFGAGTTLGSPTLRTVLMMVLRNATTDSPWPLSNNPDAMYNAESRADSNLKIPLWQLVRASTAAPVYFPPEVIAFGDNRFCFVDGGITMYNNPAFQMFLMATLPQYQMRWQTGEDEMLIVSVGTGHAPDANKDLEPSDMNLLYNAGSIPSALMAAALHEQDTLCRVFGKCLAGDAIDREIGDLKNTLAPGGKNLFTYVRYNAELTERGLERLGLKDIDPIAVRKLDSIKAIPDLQRIGRAIAEKDVESAPFTAFLPGRRG
jgi:patatin-like phospholipase/acyl hydrolase